MLLIFFNYFSPLREEIKSMDESLIKCWPQYLAAITGNFHVYLIQCKVTFPFDAKLTLQTLNVVVVRKRSEIELFHMFVGKSI